MNKEQLEHFARILQNWKRDLMVEVDRTVLHMKDEAANFPDPNDRATQEEEFSLELRTRDRELFSGITWHTSVNFGFTAQDGGVLPLAPSPSMVQTEWQKGLEVFAASPLIHGPLSVYKRQVSLPRDFSRRRPTALTG